METNVKSKPMLEVVEYLLPNYLASYLINGDASGITQDEQNEIDAFLKSEGVSIVDIKEDSNFYYRNDLKMMGAECSTYVGIII